MVAALRMLIGQIELVLWTCIHRGIGPKLECLLSLNDVVLGLCADTMANKLIIATRALARFIIYIASEPNRFAFSYVFKSGRPQSHAR